jgi:hypothetical protein
VVPGFGSGGTAVGCGLPVAWFTSHASVLSQISICAWAWWVATNGPDANSTIAAEITTVLKAIVLCVFEIIRNFHEKLLVCKHLKKCATLQHIIYTENEIPE